MSSTKENGRPLSYTYHASISSDGPAHLVRRSVEASAASLTTHLNNEKAYVTVSHDKERDMTVMSIVTSHLVITPLRPLDWSDTANDDGKKDVRETILHQFFFV